MTEPFKPYEEVCPDCEGSGMYDPDYKTSGDRTSCFGCYGRGINLSAEGAKFIDFLDRHFDVREKLRNMLG